VLFYPGHGSAKVADPFTKRAPDLRETLGSENEQSHRENKDQVSWLNDVAEHSLKDSPEIFATIFWNKSFARLSRLLDQLKPQQAP
jgi:hypothetical protein